MPSLPAPLITSYAGQALDYIRLAGGMEIMREPFLLGVVGGRVKALFVPQPSGKVG